MGAGYDVAVVGADGLVGAAIVEALEQRSFPVRTLYALVGDGTSSSVPDFRGQRLRPREIAGFDFSKARLAFFNTDDDVSSQYATQAARDGCIVIDGGASFRANPNVPLVVPEVNPHALSRRDSSRIIASPASETTALAIAISPFLDCGIECLTVTAHYAVSEEGMEAVEAFARQSASMLGGQGVENGDWSTRRAFNLIPQVGRMLEDGSTEREFRLLEETRRVLDSPELRMNVTAIKAPVFYGHSFVVRVETRKLLSVAEAKKRFGGLPTVTLIDGAQTGDCPTAITHAAEGDAVFVGRLRGDLCHTGGINFWIVADNVRKSAALNSVRIAELLISNHFQESESLPEPT